MMEMSLDRESDGNMIDSTAVVVAQQASLAEFGPMGSIAEVRSMYAQMKEFISGELKEGQDYGTTPGTGKPALWKPGAEKFCFWFTLGIDYDHVAGEVTAQRVSHTYKCRLVSLRTGQLKATCEGSCNTDETKYSRTLDTLREKYPQATALTLDNTIRKMAQKRALVGATLNATGASAYFSTHTEGGEEEEGGNGKAAPNETRICTVHNAPMTRRISQKTGKPYWAHEGPDGKFCFGGKGDDKAQPAPAAAPVAPAPAPADGSVPHFETKGDQLTWIQAQVKALQWPSEKLAQYVKANWMRASLSQLAQEELDDLCSRLLAESAGEPAM